MKLRIRGNSVRLRLAQSEVRRLADGGAVEDWTDFGAGRRLGYALRADDVPAAVATFDGAVVSVRIPREAARQLARTDQVAVDARQPVGGGAELKILVEKDFECLDAPADESQIDAFPHPHGGCEPRDGR